MGRERQRDSWKDKKTRRRRRTMEWKFAERLEWTCCCCFPSKLENWGEFTLWWRAGTKCTNHPSSKRLWCKNLQHIIYNCKLLALVVHQKTSKQAPLVQNSRQPTPKFDPNKCSAPNKCRAQTRQILLHQERNSIVNSCCCFIKAKHFLPRGLKKVFLCMTCVL